MLEQYQWYQKELEEGEKKHPELEDRYCKTCGCRLVRGSINWLYKEHLDGCD